MQSKLINLLEIINNDVSCENKDHRHRKPYDGNFFYRRKSCIYDGIADCRRRFPWLREDTIPSLPLTFSLQLLLFLYFVCASEIEKKIVLNLISY